MRFVLLMAAIFLAGCSHTSAVSILDGDILTVTHRGATGAESSAAVRDTAMAFARAHCAELGKTFALVELVENKPPFILGNFPQTEVQFRCN